MKKLISGIILQILVANAIAQTQWNPSGYNIFFNTPGYVGIGTDAPRSKMEVVGVSRFSSGATGSSIFIDASNLPTTNGWSNVRLVAGGDGGSANLKTLLDNWGGYFSWARGSESGEVEVMRINASNGNIGIGTTNPLHKLDVRNGFISTRDANSYSGAFVQGANGIAHFGSLGTDRIAIGNATNWEMLNILNNGSVGIGTANPKSYKLAVGGGDIKSYNYDNNTGISIGAEASERPRIGFHVSDNNRRFKIEYNGVNGPQERLGIFTANGGAWSETEVFTIGKTGNIGIGTITPESKLHVEGEQLITGHLDVGGRHDGLGYGNTIRFGKVGNTDPVWMGRYNTGVDKSELRLNIGDGVDAADKFIVGTHDQFGTWLPSLAVNAAGQVAIGTADTYGYSLAVKGEAIFTKVKVKAFGTWPDYVFEPTYKLPTLQEVETFIRVNKHLPDVPPAKEVDEKGLNLGDNQTVLLKKIEELTLYAIEAEKKIQTLATQNLQQLEINKTLEERLTQLEKRLKQQQ